MGIKFDGDPLEAQQNNYAVKIVNAYTENDLEH